MVLALAFSTAAGDRGAGAGAAVAAAVAFEFFIRKIKLKIQFRNHFGTPDQDPDQTQHTVAVELPSPKGATTPPTAPEIKNDNLLTATKYTCPQKHNQSQTRHPRPRTASKVCPPDPGCLGMCFCRALLDIIIKI